MHAVVVCITNLCVAVFGFLDGISQPCLVGICTPNPGQMVSQPGVIIFGMDGDDGASSRPTWTRGGSLLVFRQLDQKVCYAQLVTTCSHAEAPCSCRFRSSTSFCWITRLLPPISPFSSAQISLEHASWVGGKA